MRTTISANNSNPNVATDNSEGTPACGRYYGLLWSDKYSPKHYFDLLSEEVFYQFHSLLCFIHYIRIYVLVLYSDFLFLQGLNRALLKWLKSWDSVVFRRQCLFPPLPESLVPFRNPGNGGFYEQANFSDNFRKRAQESSGERCSFSTIVLYYKLCWGS